MENKLVTPKDVKSDTLVQYRRKDLQGNWSNASSARYVNWSSNYDYRIYEPLKAVSDAELRKEVESRGWTVEQPLVTQAEREFVEGLLYAGNWVESRISTTNLLDQQIYNTLIYLKAHQ